MSATAVPDEPINAKLTEREVLTSKRGSRRAEMTAGFGQFGFTLHKTEP